MTEPSSSSSTNTSTTRADVPLFTEERESLLGEQSISSEAAFGRSEDNDEHSSIVVPSETSLSGTSSVQLHAKNHPVDSKLNMMHASSSSYGGAFQRKNTVVSSNHGNASFVSQELIGNNNGDGNDGHVTNTSISESFMEKRDNMVKQQAALIGTVRRSKCGTSPFDDRWLNTDCCGLFCAGFTYSLHLYGCFAVSFKLVKPWFYNHETEKWGMIGVIHIVVFVSIAILACINHFLAMTTDPGAVPPDAAPIPDSEIGLDEETAFKLNPAKLGRRYCRRCNSYKPQRAHHCSICKRCVVKMDHHCPWVNNCVGIGNHKFFLLFIFYTFCSCLYSFSLLFWRGWNCGVLPKGNDPCMDNPGDLVFLVGLAIESLLFGLFTSCMIIDQIETVTTNLTQIDRLKGERLNSNLPDVNEVFGGNGVQNGFRLDWLAPIAVKFPASIRDEIYGFCTPCAKVIGVKSDDAIEMAALTKNSEVENSSLDIV